jgi:hypothetical protein
VVKHKSFNHKGLKGQHSGKNNYPSSFETATLFW